MAQTQAGVYTNNFDADPTTSTNGVVISGNGASWQATGGNPATGGFLRITPAEGSMFGALFFGDIDTNQVVAGFDFECDLRIGNGTTSPADGFSINYARANDPVVQYALANNGQITSGAGFSDVGNAGDLSLPEEGTQTGLAIGFDAWDSGTIATTPNPPAVGEAAPGITHDYPAISIRVDNVLVQQIRMPTLNGAVTDPTSLQTGPNDASNSENGLGWAHLKVNVSTNGLINVTWKNTLIVSNYQSSFYPSAGRLIFAGRTGGSFQVQDVDNISLTTYPAASFLVGPVTATPNTLTFTISNSGQNVADTNTIALTLNGTSITASSISTSNGITTVTYTAPTGVTFASGSTNTVGITVKSTGANPVTLNETRQAVAPVYANIPLTAMLSAGSVNTAQRGFKIRTYQVDAVQPNSNENAEAILAGLRGPNVADTNSAGGLDAQGFFTWTNVINFDIDPAAANGHYNTPDYPDFSFPGIPGTVSSNSPTENFALEIYTAVEFPAAGLYRMIINSDDGFRTTSGPETRSVFNTLGEFNGGRGATDSPFQFFIPQAGIYPFRTLYQQGGGGANIEWLVVNTNGTQALLNDVTNSLPAYQWAPTNNNATYVRAITPGFGVSGASPSLITAEVVGGAAALPTNAFTLTLNGATVQPSITTTGNVSYLTYNINPFLAAGSANRATLAYGTGTNAVTNTWQFTVVNYGSLQPSWAVTPDTTKPGFLWRIHQTTESEPNENNWAEEQLRGQHGANIVDTNAVGVAIGAGVIATNNTNLVQFEIPGVINLSITAGEANGNFTPDEQMPGIPGLAPDGTPSTINIATEILTFIDLPAGLLTMGVNSDDGFRTTAGPINNPTNTFLGEYNGGRGAADTTFQLLVTQAGVYPFRTLWEQGGGGGNIEWFTINTNGAHVLLNDTTNGGFRTYRFATGSTNQPPSTNGPALTFTRGTNGLTINWTGTGTLESATNVVGPWTPMTGQNSPVTVPFTGGSQAFYRLRQ